ncbi:unnamed protein product [Microthlaspi erraticum]|uniref:Retrotransposon gag domain-containing protein n=1 Tax=Microthlaspi erraticum TaxID=1685480 RepID=A0A6D2HLT0_9BRAS|nr:unnamed protein product [Microthlaspi erraticum]
MKKWFAAPDNFDQLISAFVNQYSIFIESEVSEADLWKLSQAPNESLRSYVNRFKEIIAKIENPNEAVALLAFRNNLWYKSKFREELIVRPPVSLDDALRCASTFATLEEKINLLLERHRKEGLPQHFLSFANSILKPNPSSDLEKFCEHHQIYGHSTDECRVRAKELAKKRRAEAKIEKANQPSSNDNDKAPRKREREIGIISQESPLSHKKRFDSTRCSESSAHAAAQ